MNDLVEKDPLTAEPQPVAEEDERPTFLVIAQFFIIPLVVILVCVGLFYMFGLMTEESRDATSYLSEIRQGSKTRRFQAAYELSRMLAQDKEIAREPGFAAELSRVFVESEDEEPGIRRYLALALGQVADPRGVSALLTGLDDSDAETRIYVIWALGAVGDPRAVPPIVERLSDPDAGVRKMAVHTLGMLGDSSAVPDLKLAMEDPVADVQWNAALSLGRMGDPAALPVLRRMLDREYLDRVDGITPEQKAAAMVNAIRALVLLEDRGVVDLLTRVGDADPDLEVRSAALEALTALGG